MGFVDDHIDKSAASQLLVKAGGGEVHVAGDVVAFIDHGLADEVLCAAALVGRDDIFVPIIFLDSFLEVIEIDAAGVSLVTEHDAGPLAVAHRAGAAVGQQVDVDIRGAQQEGVVSGLFGGFGALCLADHFDRFDHLDLPRLGP